MTDIHTGLGAAYRNAIARLAAIGEDEPVFSRALVLAHGKSFDLRCTTQLLQAFVAPPPPIQWSKLGHPGAERCQAMVRAVNSVANRIEAERAGLPEGFWRECLGPTIVPEVLVYATLRQFVPCTFDEVVGVLGVDLVLERLHDFCGAVRGAALAG